MNTLDYIVYGKPSDSDPLEPARVLALSGELTPEDAAQWREYVTIEPLQADETDSGAFGIFEGPDDNYLLVRCYLRETESGANSVYQVIIASRHNMQMMGGHLRQILEALREPLPETLQTEPIAPIPVPNTPTWTVDKRRANFNEYDVSDLLYLLGAALDERRLLIQGYEPDLMARVRLMEAIIMLLPGAAQPLLTFSTNMTDFSKPQPDVAFLAAPLDETPDEGQSRYRLWDTTKSPSTLGDEVLQSSYMQFICEAWRGDLPDFLATLRALDMVAAAVMPDQGLLPGLEAVIERHRLDQVVLSDEDVNVEDLKTVLDDSPPRAEGVRLRYTERLLDYALQERDTEAVEILSKTMTEDQKIRALVDETLRTTLDTEPDAVYFFLRTHLAGSGDSDWLPLLHDAAQRSLAVAIEDGDNETLMTWFRLLAREPASYQLDDVLRDSIQAVQPRTYSDGVLGSQLLTLLARRRPAMIDMLLDDPNFLSALLETPLGPALRECNPEAIASIINAGARETSLIVLGRAATHITDPESNPLYTNAVGCFSAGNINYLWSVYRDEKEITLPPPYQPSTILDRISKQVHLLPTGAINTLLNQTITLGEDDRFRRISAQIGPERLLQYLVGIYQESDLAPKRLIPLVGLLIEDETLTRQQAVNMYLRIASNLDWKRENLPLVEQAVRLMQKNSEIEVPIDQLWRILQLAAEAEVELVARVTMRRILEYVRQQENDEMLANTLLRLNQNLTWSNSAQNYLLGWCREYVQSQSLTRLQHLNRALAGKKQLNTIIAIVQTTISVRKMLGNRTLEEFAADVSTTFNVLQAISDSFDPTSRQYLAFDPTTVRTEIDVLDDTMTPDERSVLAKNLKELAQLIIAMSDQRSKANLIRREEDIERQLVTGEQQPQSAVDTMKWLSGYLNGVQGSDDDE